jgi:hypothetical protein
MRTQVFSLLCSIAIPQIDGFDPIYLRFRPLAAQDVVRLTTCTRSGTAELVLAGCHAAAGLGQCRRQLTQALYLEFRGLILCSYLCIHTRFPPTNLHYQAPVWTMKTFSVFRSIVKSTIKERWSIYRISSSTRSS